MRKQVDFVDTNLLPWGNPKPGIYSKMLSLDPDTTARTALTRAVPAEGYKDQPMAHCHETSEEIVVVKGRLAFDSRCWLAPGGYVYHPPHWVHGFNSTVPEETWFISRVGEALTWTYYEEPDDDFPYHRDGAEGGREAVVVASPWATRWETLPSAEGRIRQFTYSHDLDQIERTVLRRYDPGALDAPSASDTLETREEFYVYEGVVEDQDGQRLSQGFYACLLPGSRRPRFRGVEDAIIYHHVSSERG